MLLYGTIPKLEACASILLRIHLFIGTVIQCNMAKPFKSRNDTLPQCDEKPQRDEKSGRFLAGNSGNGGRHVGSRNRLATEFLDALAEDFSKHGIEAIEQVRQDRPDKYLQIVAHLLPRHAELDVLVSHDLTSKVQRFAEAWAIVSGGMELIEATDVA
jgi:hypothetical protein